MAVRCHYGLEIICSVTKQSLLSSKLCGESFPYFLNIALFLWLLLFLLLLLLLLCLSFCFSQCLGDSRPEEVKYLPGNGLLFLGWKLGGSSPKTLEGDASAESSGMSGSVTWTVFPGKGQDVHKHGVVREPENTEGGSSGTTDT